MIDDRPLFVRRPSDVLSQDDVPQVSASRGVVGRLLGVASFVCRMRRRLQLYVVTYLLY